MPNTIADNLQALDTARLNIADVIINKGGTVNTDKRFSLFPDDINTIPTANLTTLDVTENGTYYKSTPTEITSPSFPMTLNNSLGTPLLDFLVSGNMSQTGTPTPDNPIQPQETGERTGNLFDENYSNIKVDRPTYRSIYVGDGTFTLSTTTARQQNAANVFFLAGNVETGASTQNNGVWNGNPRTVSAVDGYITIAYRYYMGNEESDPRSNDVMLNSGSTALPYEPYGYKLTISSANTTTPIYLGEVETTRQIKKSVLTGTDSDGITNATAQGII